MWCTMTRINFGELGRVYIYINIKPLNDTTMLPVRFKVDTGADTSTISKLSLEVLGYDADWIRQNANVFGDKDKPVTASDDKVEAGLIQLPIINILDYEGKGWPFQIIMDEEQDFRNLLGRDLLTGFNYQFDNDNDVFSIDKTKIFKPRYKFLPGQEIHELVS